MLNVIYEDKDKIIVNKPAGQLSQSARGFDMDLVSEVLTYRKNKGEEAYAAIINRLDRPVSGLVLIAKNKKEAIEHLAGKLKDAGYIADVDSYIEDIYLRESQGQTGIGHYVAIPHGKSDSVTQVGIAIGKVQDEIEWETLDGNGVKLIFLFAVGNDNENAKTHLRLLAEVARTLGNDDAVEALLNASTVEDLKAVFA